MNFWENKNGIRESDDKKFGMRDSREKGAGMRDQASGRLRITSHAF